MPDSFSCLLSRHSTAANHYTFPSETPTTQKLPDFQKSLAGTFAALTIASSVLTNAAPPADAFLPSFGSSQLVAEKVVREGIYGEYEVDLPDQVYDDARSTFKPAKETKSKKGRLICFRTTSVLFTLASFFHFLVGKYTALLAVLIVGSFIIPMAQYFWYVRDDDSSEKFFAQNVPPPPPEKPKKKGWF